MSQQCGTPFDPVSKMADIIVAELQRRKSSSTGEEESNDDFVSSYYDALR